MSWKSVLYEYVHWRNETEGGGIRKPTAPNILDQAFLAAEELRIRRREHSHATRSLHTLKHETRLRMLGVEEQADRAVAHIELRKRFDYEIAGRPHLEEQAERQQLKFHKRDGHWWIDGILPYIAENDSTRPFNPARPVERAEAARGSSSEPSSPSDPALYSDASHRPQTGTSSSAGETREHPLLGQGGSGSPLISGPVYSPFEAAPRVRYYNREAAVQYADRWWNSYNPQYVQFEVDCTSFVSQCLFAGNAPMNYTGKRDSGWWYRGKSGHQELWSYSWAVAHSLQHYLGTSRSGLRGIEVASPAQLTIGDTICYSWDGGRFNHNTIVTAFAADGMPLVHAHTVNSRYRYWDYHDSYAYTPATAYRFFHIPDQM